MATNAFLPPGTDTTLTVLFDRPKEGTTRYGPYRAYRVRTPDGAEHTFLPPRSLFPELDQLRLGRGSQLTVRTSQRVSRDGRAFLQYELGPGSPDPNAASALAGSTPNGDARARSDRSSMLACVALKAAAASHGAVANAGDIVKVAEFYQAWLEGRSETMRPSDG